MAQVLAHFKRWDQVPAQTLALRREEAGLLFRTIVDHLFELIKVRQNLVHFHVRVLRVIYLNSKLVVVLIVEPDCFLLELDLELGWSLLKEHLLLGLWPNIIVDDQWGPVPRTVSRGLAHQDK